MSGYVARAWLSGLSSVTSKNSMLVELRVLANMVQQHNGGVSSQEDLQFIRNDQLFELGKPVNRIMSLTIPLIAADGAQSALTIPDVVIGGGTRKIYNLSDYGCFGDGQQVTAVISIDNGSTELYSTTALGCTSADVGKPIVFTAEGMGEFVYYPAFASSISAVSIDSKHVTIADAYTGTSLSGATKIVEWGSDDNPSLVAANADMAAWQASHPDEKFQLNVPAGRYELISYHEPINHFTNGLKNVVVVGAGKGVTTFSSFQGKGWYVWWGGFGTYGVNDPSKGVFPGSRLADVSSGSSSVTLLTPDSLGDPAGISEISRFHAGDIALMAGIDVMGFGYPVNAGFWEFVRIASVDAGTGVVTFTAPLAYSYKAHWPLYNAGRYAGANANDNGGPASLFPMDQSFDVTVKYQDFSVDNPSQQQFCLARSATWERIGTVNTTGIIVSQCPLTNFIDVDQPNAGIEFDKVCGTVNITRMTVDALSFQSTGANEVNITGSTFGLYLIGCPRKTTITDTTIPAFRPGAFAYGISESLVCNNCVINDLQLGGGVSVHGIEPHGVQNCLNLSDAGVISFPFSVSIADMANNGSGLIRVTVSTSTAGLKTGKVCQIANVGGTSGANGVWEMSVVDGTHVDLVGSTWIPDSYVPADGGTIYGPGLQTWAVPGANCYFTESQENSGFPFTVTDIWQDDFSTYIQTTLGPGGFPPYPGSTVVNTDHPLYINAHPMPSATFIDCTGCQDVVDASQFRQDGLPLWSYTKRTFSIAASGNPALSGYVNAMGLAGSPSHSGRVWGKVVYIKYNVTKAYTGSQDTLYFSGAAPFGNYRAIKADASSFLFGPFIDLKATGERVITPIGVTGAKPNDIALSIPEAVWLTGPLTLGATVDVSSEDSGVWPIVTVEVLTDQGIAPP